MLGSITRLLSGASRAAQVTQAASDPKSFAISTLASAGARKLDQLLGLDEQSTNPQGVAVENEQNRQNTIETSDSGSMGVSSPTSDYQQAVINRLMGQQQQASFVGPALNIAREVGTRVVPLIRKNLPTLTGIGIGGGAAMLSDLYEQQGLCSTNKGGMPYSVSKTTGCISVTRKQQKMLKELVMTVGMERASDTTGLSQTQIGLLIVKKFPNRSRGITGASMRTTRRTIRQLTRYAHDLDEFCKRPTPTRRRRTK